MSTFGTWEFDPCHHAGYLGDIDFFSRELLALFDDDEEDMEDKEGTSKQEDELQPPNLTEEDAMEMAIANTNLDELAPWDGLAIQLRASVLAQGRPPTPLVTPPAPAPPPAARIPPPVSQQHLHWPWPWGSPIYIYPVDDDDNDN
jgi:hypothetical protein